MTWEEFIAECIPAPSTVRVKPFAGAGAYGVTYGPDFDLGPCYVEDVPRAVTVQTVDAYGTEHLSSTTVFAPLLPEVLPDSLITVPWRVRPAKVVAVQRLTDGGNQLPQHQEISLE